MLQAEHVEAVEMQGLRSDHSYGRARRQVLLVESETLQEFELSPGLLRENIVTRGLTYAGCPKGTQLQLGPVILEVTMECTPCSYLEELRPGLMEALRGRRGTLCRVVRGGSIQLGDPVDYEVDD
jgi:MOSC domain-containing protein YiiM